jgi:hypothetical protein
VKIERAIEIARRRNEHANLSARRALELRDRLRVERIRHHDVHELGLVRPFDRDGKCGVLDRDGCGDDREHSLVDLE